MPLAVTLKSIESASSEIESLPITVFTIDFNADARDLVKASVPGLDLQFIDIGQHVPQDLPEMRWFSRAAYARLIAPRLMPSTRRIIYLDADLVVKDDLWFLAQYELSGHAVGAVRSSIVPTVSSPMAISGWAELGLSPLAPYFNSGVLVIDRKRWSEQDVERRVLAYLREHRDSVQFADQDGLNAVLAGDFAPLPLRWNQESHLRVPLHLAYSFFPEGEVRDAVARPAIIHFTGKQKPWQHYCEDSGAAEWWEVLATTRYAGYKRPKGPWRDRAMYHAGRVLRAPTKD